MAPIRYKKKFGLRYHGNYCGPGWSAGQFRDSVAYSNVQPVDDFDKSCRDHDRSYALNGDVKQADYEFYGANIGKGLKRSLAAIAVGTQGYFRSSKNNSNTEIMPPTRKPKYRVVPVPARKKTTRNKSVSRMSSARTRGLLSKVSSVSLPRRMSTSITVSKSSGKLYGTHKFKSYRPKKKFSESHTLVVESSGDMTASRKCAHLVHATHPIQQTTQLFCQALLRYLAYRLGFHIPNFTNLLNEDVDITYRYYPNSQTNTAFTVVINAVSAGSWFAAANALRTSIEAVCQIDTNRDIAFQEFGLQRTGTNQSVFINSKDFMVSVYTKSSLKIQNRSRNALGTEADEVDNCPIYGTMHDCKGNGAQWRDYQRPAGQLIAEGLTGIGTVNGDLDSTQFLYEPLDRADLVGVQKTQKICIEPGQIKTSVMTKRDVFGIQKLSKAIQSIKQTYRAKTNLGFARIISLEKMIALNTEDEAFMSIFFELNNKYIVQYKHSPRHAPVKQFISYNSAS